MKIDNLVLKDNVWEYASQGLTDGETADIVFIFGDTDIIKLRATYETIKARFPNSHLIGSSSSGNILGREISKFPIVATAVKFESSRVEVQSIEYHEGESLSDLSYELVNKLSKEGLKHIFLLSDGLKINGSDLVKGVNLALTNVEVTGGLAGDGARFQETYVICDDEPKASIISAVGFYGENLIISSGCFGGWSEFGTNRVITKSKANVLYEIDNEPALDFYKRYLGDYAKDLPNSGLRFPLSIKKDDNDSEVIRTLLGIDEENKSITFAGDVPEGYYAKLMKPDTDELIQGAGHAANKIVIANDKPALGLVVSCVGRKLVLGQLIDEELEEVGETLGSNINLIGFYSYGEIAPFEVNKLQCSLHNQTMTLTAIYEN
ncbi:MAG: FIST C-terminal domain-containing protein [Sulfuricurvum sp.]|nr:FIST C-terminal domain-containing protein [Sulfuricurvum sp.]